MFKEGEIVFIKTIPNMHWRISEVYDDGHILLNAETCTGGFMGEWVEENEIERV